jgi:hypothetical protein
VPHLEGALAAEKECHDNPICGEKEFPPKEDRHKSHHLNIGAPGEDEDCDGSYDFANEDDKHMKAEPMLPVFNAARGYYRRTHGTTKDPIERAMAKLAETAELITKKR